MSDFKELQNQLQQARVVKEQARAELFQARVEIKRIEAEMAWQDRTFNSHDQAHRGRRQTLEEMKAAALAALKEHERVYAEAAEIERELSQDFFKFTDPREQIKLLGDDFPFLMLPVRIETRFKTVTTDGRPRRQIWARIYPDDCSIDSFEASLSEGEVRAARRFWIEVWKAGGIEDQQRAAWRALAADIGSGRAAWASQNYRPQSAAPVKANSEDVILVVVTDAPLVEEEESRVAGFWKTVWLADGDKAKEGAARAALEAEMGEARATEIIRRYRPVNLDEKSSPTLKESSCAPNVEFLVLPGPEDRGAKQHSLTEAAKVNTLPDRFVLIGYNGGQRIFEAVGRQIRSPLTVGADTAASPGERLKDERLKKDGESGASDEALWMTDFDRAVECGMGFKIDLIETQWRAGFDRLLAVGIRLSADEFESKRLIESLIDNHYYGRAGFSLLPQGAPIHNACGGDAADDGAGRPEDLDASYDYFFKNKSRFEITDDAFSKRDGQWLAEYLGIDPAVLGKVSHAESRDQLEARAMNVALWPATFGYWMETMMNPLFDDRDVEAMRWFLTHFVSGRGSLPAVRIGAHPYGILPTTAFSRIKWISPEGFKPVAGIESPKRAMQFLKRLSDILQRLSADWQNMSNNVSFVGKPGDAHQSLLDVVGLHSGSVEYFQRYAESRQQLFNRLNLEGYGDAWAAVDTTSDRMQLIGQFGYKGKAAPDILEKFFLSSKNLLRGPIVDDRPLSESELIRGYTDDNRDYIRWLIDAARTSLETLRRQTGFTEDKAPNALLYLLLRHALILGYWDADLRLRVEAGVCAEADVKALRRESAFIHVHSSQEAGSAGASESRWFHLYRPEPRITGDPSQSVYQFIPKIIGGATSTRYLNQQIEALDRLKDAPTARLERALAEHIDCCSYRLDAWQSGLINYQIAARRYQRHVVRGESQITARQGLYIGAYGWLEEVRPANKQLAPARLDPKLDKVFNQNRADQPRTEQTQIEQPLMRDVTNGGYIHAPSPKHAVTAAVLRSGYLSNATPSNPQTQAVNLSSERVRLALSILEGVRGGGSLGALLGYQFERGLHDRRALSAGTELDEIIFKIRKEFPLRANRIGATGTVDEPGEAINAAPDMMANGVAHVVDGLSLINQVKKAGPASENKKYPFGKPLPPATPALAAAISAEVDRLIDIHDAVADLVIAEGAHQAVQGKFDRVAATLDAFSAGGLPPEPEVVQTPRGGVLLTHRVGLHLESGLKLVGSPVADVAMTPRAKAEPALNKWLATMLPAPGDVGCLARFCDPATGAMVEREVTQRDLKLQPIDLLYMLRTDSRQAMAELDDRILKHVVQTFDPRYDLPVTILHTKRLAGGKISFFELTAQVNCLRSITLGSRPLRPTDIALGEEARLDESVFLDKSRIVAVKIGLGTLHSQMVNFHTPLGAMLAEMRSMRDQLEKLRNDPETHRNKINALRAELEFKLDQVFANVDDYIDQIVNLLSTAGLFSVPQTGWSFAFEMKRAAVVCLLKKVAELVERWEERLNRYNQLIDEYNALPLKTGDQAKDQINDQKRFELLRKAESILFTKAISRQPSSPAILKNTLDLKLEGFISTLNDFKEVLREPNPSLALLLDDVKVVLPVDDYDPEGIKVEEVEQRILTFTADAANLAKSVAKEVDRRIKSADERLLAHDNAVTASARAQALQAAAKILLGEDFQVIPEYNLTADQGVEWEKALAARGELLSYLTGELKQDFPVDDWLYGVARVRDKMRSWEQAVIFAEAFGKAEARLDPIQLPYKEGDRWLALKFPDNRGPEGERLLYSAHYAAPFQKNTRLSGLLIDEWTEVIPAAEATTGVAFHFDRSNSEPPQVMLLVTSPDFSGSWSWIDLVAALNETLDWSKRRAVEPVHIDATPYAQFLPATGAAATLFPISIALGYGANNNLHEFMNGHNDD